MPVTVKPQNPVLAQLLAEMTQLFELLPGQSREKLLESGKFRLSGV